MTESNWVRLMHDLGRGNIRPIFAVGAGVAHAHIRVFVYHMLVCVVRIMYIVYLRRDINKNGFRPV